MKKEVNGIELLQLIHDNRINNKERIYSKTFDDEFYWSGRNLKNEDYEYLNKYNDIDFIEDIFVINIEPTADELFEKLGYEKFSNDEYSFEYRKFLDGELFEIDFWKKDKTISKNYCCEMGYITTKELQAINKKVEELGWLQ